MKRNLELLTQLASREPAGSNRSAQSPLISLQDVDEFLRIAAKAQSGELNDILDRAITFALQSRNQDLESSFISLFASLESILTFFRRQDDYEILAAKEFGELERDLKKWLKQHPLLAKEAAKRALIYEKLRELNRFPLGHIFEKFCDHYSLSLADLWPVIGKHADWPLTEIRHRLLHGDPFENRPVEALACARMHLTWVVERMLLSVLGWPVAKSNVSGSALKHNKAHEGWREERSKLG